MFRQMLVSPLVLLVLAVPTTAAPWSAPWSVEVEEALECAGRNRDQLESVLDHYAAGDDEQKLAAAEFLIANMDGHGHTVTVLLDTNDNEVRFSALNHRDYSEAQAVMDALEQEHGTVEFGRKRFDQDLETITAGYLMENIDLAFEAWRTRPWAAEIKFEAFLEYLLPYRGSNEPLGWWRRDCLQRFDGLEAKMDDSTDIAEAARRIGDEVRTWVQFQDRFYLHPTDQSYEQMMDRGAGRCEDISNMTTYAMRANAVLNATDYTPWWAHRDNNHAWPVVLDAAGRGSSPDGNRAAKVYRKMFSIQRDSLGFLKNDEEKVPRWLAGTNYRDVTSEYCETSNVELQLTEPVPDEHRFAYLCVFNGGEWRAIHWGKIETDRAEFTRMGREIVYLPAYYVDGKLVPAAPPILLGADGEARPQVRLKDAEFGVELVPKSKDAADPAAAKGVELTSHPIIAVEPGRTYELLEWYDGDWRSQGRRKVSARSRWFRAIPEGVLLWLVDVNGKRLERPFTVEGGVRRSW